jgi:tRNA A-37 threonylcarbamoyl transferase component Bud32
MDTYGDAGRILDVLRRVQTAIEACLNVPKPVRDALMDAVLTIMHAKYPQNVPHVRWVVDRARKIGEGTSAAVYRACYRWPDGSGDRYVVKIMPPSSVDPRREVDMCIRASRLGVSPTVLARWETGDGFTYVVTDWVHRRGKEHLYRPAETPNHPSQFCDVLRMISGEGMVHNDLQVANVLFAEDGRLQLIDWGLGTQMPRDHPNRVLHATNLNVASVLYNAEKKMKRAGAFEKWIRSHWRMVAGLIDTRFSVKEISWIWRHQNRRPEWWPVFKPSRFRDEHDFLNKLTRWKRMAQLR